MYPQFLSTFINKGPQTPSANIEPVLRRIYGKPGHNLGDFIKNSTGKAKVPVAALRAALKEAWARALAAYLERVQQRSTIAPISSDISDPLTPAEIDLTKKALLLGKDPAEVYALPLERNGSNFVLPGGRFGELASFVIEESLAKASELAANKPYAAAYWILHASPSDAEPPSERRRMLIAAQELNLVQLPHPNQLFLTLYSEKRSPVTTIPEFIYLGSGRGTEGFLASLHLPNARKHLPKGPFFTFKVEGAIDKYALFGFSGQNTVLITDHRDNSSDIRLTGTYFPRVFAGPHMLSRFERAIQVLGNTLNYNFSVDTSEMAALLSVKALTRMEICPSWGRYSNTNIIELQPEMVCGLTHDRGVRIYVSGQEEENKSRVKSLLDQFTSELSSKS